MRRPPVCCAAHRCTHDHERQLPGRQITQYRQPLQAEGGEEIQRRAAQEKCQASADGGTGEIHAYGKAQSLGWKVVGENGQRGRGERGLTHADAYPGDEQLKKIAGEAAGHGHAAPQEHADGDQALAVAAIDDAADGDAEEGVEKDKREAAQQAHFGVGDIEVFLDGPHQQRDDLPVDEGQHKGQHQHTVDVPGQRRLGPVHLLCL
jgi:hypothetical protein